MWRNNFLKSNDAFNHTIYLLSLYYRKIKDSLIYILAGLSYLSIDIDLMTILYLLDSGL